MAELVATNILNESTVPTNGMLHISNKTLGRALDPRANGAWLSKLTQ